MHNIHRRGSLPVLHALLATSFFGCLPASAAPTVALKAQELLRQSAAAYGALHSFSCQARTELKLDSVPGSRVIKIKLAFQAPNKAMVTVDKYDETIQYLSDGTNLYIYSPEKKQYIQDKLPPNVPATAPVLTQGQSFVGLLLIKPAGLTAFADVSNAASLTVGPPETLDGLAVQAVTKVIIGRDGGKMTMTVTLGVKDHLVHRFVSTIRSTKPLVPKEGDVRQIDNQETYTDIHIDPILAAATFLPPLGAAKAETDK